MTKDELIKLLNGHEWNNVEFKKAQRGVPESAYETVSSFSNTGGGWLVFGIRDYDGHYEVAGVLEVDKVQNDFLSALRAGNKMNHDIKVETELIDVEDKTVLVFRIPEASRQDKPIYLNGDIRRSFIRRGGCDQRCTMPEIERFLRDAAEERWDGQVFSYPLDEAFHQESIKWYRALFNLPGPPFFFSEPRRQFIRCFPDLPLMFNGFHQILVNHYRKFAGWTVWFLRIISSSRGVGWLPATCRRQKNLSVSILTPC
jgi:ATP-dependent DNA helicase RecG